MRSFYFSFVVSLNKLLNRQSAVWVVSDLNTGMHMCCHCVEIKENISALSAILDSPRKGPTLGSYSGISVLLVSGQDSSSQEPGVTAQNYPLSLLPLDKNGLSYSYPRE